MSSIDTRTSSILQNTVNASQTEINNLLKQLSTGLKITSASDDPANIYVSNTLNLEALENSATSGNAQSGLTYLQIAQKAYSDIVTELNKIKDLANKALTGTYDSVQIEDFQNQITESINAIKLIETGTTFNGIQVFNNTNSTGLVNEHMFAITSKTDVIITTATIIDDRGKDYSEYLTNDIDRYEKKDIGGSIALVNDNGGVIAFNTITISTDAQFKAIVSGMTLGIGLDKNYVLGKNFDIAAMGINTNGKALFQGNFIGTFDGAGYTISNLTINNTDASIDGYKSYYGCDSRDTTGQHGVGLFDIVSGSVANLTLSNINITIAGNVNRVGALAAVATAGATISNVNVASATLTGGTDSKGMGGLVGVVDNATISDSSANATITGAWSLGGLVGALQNGGIIKNSTASGTVNANQASAQTANYYYGGSQLDRMIGGFVGYMSGSSTLIDSSRTSVAVSSSYQYTGGFAGIITDGTVTNSYATGNVTSTSLTAGGFAADIRANATITNCYVSNSVTATGNLGGFYGQSAGSTDPASINNCFYNSTTGPAIFGPAADSAKWVNSGGLTTANITGHTGNFSTYTAPWDPTVWNLGAGAPTLQSVGTHAVTSIAAGTVTTIETADQLFSALSGTTAGKVFILLDNIDLSSLGTLTQSLISPTFQGTLMGNGYAISGLSINSSGNNVGLFSQLGASAKVQDLILNDFSIKGSSNVGALAGTNAGALVTNVAALNVNNSGQSAAGGLIGTMSSGTIEYSFATGKVSGDTVSTNVGGLLGEMNTSASLVRYSFANVDVTGGTNVGGLVGGIDSPGNAGTVTQSYARGSVTGQTRVGGLVGYNSGTVSNSYALGDVTGNTNAGGLVGENYGAGASVVNSYSLSKVVDSTTVTDVNNFTVLATGETVRGYDQRPSDDYSITYTATTARGGVGSIYAFSNQADFEAFKLWDASGTVPTNIGLFYRKTDTVNNIWSGQRIGQTNTYTYTQQAMGDSSVGTPIDPDGGHYTVVGQIGGNWYAFASQEDFNNYSTYNGGGAPAQGITRFYRLTATANSWQAQTLTINPSTAYTINTTPGDPASPNIPFIVTGDNGNFDFLYNNAGNFYAFASDEDRQAFISGNAPINLFYQLTDVANNEWTSYTKTSTYEVVLGGTTVSASPNDSGADYDVIKTIGANIYAFADENDWKTLSPAGTIAPTGTVAKYYMWNSGANRWDAYSVTVTTPENYTYSISPTGGAVSGSPNAPDGEYTFMNGAYAFSSAEDLATWNNGTPNGTIAKYYHWNGGTWDEFKVTSTTTTTQADATYNLSNVGGVVSGAPNASDGEYTFMNGAYAFSSAEDLATWNNGTPTGTIAKYYHWNGGTWDAFKVTATTSQADSTYSIDTTGLGGATRGNPNDPDGNFNVFDGSGNYAFASAADLATWNGGNYTDTIGKYYHWNGSAWESQSVTVQYSVAIGGAQSGTPNDPEDEYNVIYKATASNWYAFSNETDRDNWNNGNYLGIVGKFFGSNDAGASWTAYSINQTSSMNDYDSGLLINNGALDTYVNSDPTEFNYVTGGYMGYYNAFESEDDYQRYIDNDFSLGPIYYYSIHYGSGGGDNIWTLNMKGLGNATSSVSNEGSAYGMTNDGYSVMTQLSDGSLYAFDSIADRSKFLNNEVVSQYYKWETDRWYAYVSGSTVTAGVTSYPNNYDDTTYTITIADVPVSDLMIASYGANSVLTTEDNVYVFKNATDAANYLNTNGNPGYDMQFLVLRQDRDANYMQNYNWTTINYYEGGGNPYLSGGMDYGNYPAGLGTSSGWVSLSTDNGSVYCVDSTDWFGGDITVDAATGDLTKGAGKYTGTYYKFDYETGLWTTYNKRLTIMSSQMPTIQSDPDANISYNYSYTDEFGVAQSGTALFRSNADKDVFIKYITNHDDIVGNESMMAPRLSVIYYDFVGQSGSTLLYSQKRIITGNGAETTTGLAFGESKPADYTYKYFLNYAGGGANQGFEGGFGAGQYYFMSEADASLFQDLNTHYQLGMPYDDPVTISYYKRDSEQDPEWKFYSASNMVDLYLYQESVNGAYSSKPNDANNPNDNYVHTFTTGAAQNGFEAGATYYFSSESDRSTALDIYNGTRLQSINDIQAYEGAGGGSFWTINIRSILDYNPGGTVGFVPHDPSSPESSYRYSATLNVDGGGNRTWYFASETDRQTAIDVAGNTINYPINEITGYYDVGSGNFQKAKIKSTVGAITTTYNKDQAEGSGAVGSRAYNSANPNDSFRYSASLNIDGGGAKTWYFDSETDLQTATDIANNTVNYVVDEIVGYYASGGNFQKSIIKSTPGAITTTTVYNKDQAGAGGAVGSRAYDSANPDDSFRYSASLNVDGGGLKTWYFDSETDMQTAAGIAAGTINYPVDAITGYYASGANFQKATINSVYHATVYNSANNLGTNVGSRPYDTANNIDLDSFQYIWTTAGANGITAGTYYFGSQSDMKTVQDIAAGTITGPVEDIVAYISAGAGTRQFTQQVIRRKVNAATQVSATDAYKGRADKEGFDTIYVNGGNIYAFANVADQARFNNGTPTGTIDLYYQWNSTNRNWDARKVVQNTASTSYTQTAGASYNGKPSDLEFSVLYNDGTNWYAFKDTLDKNNFIADVLGDGLKHATIDKYYRYTQATNTWADYTMTETTTSAYAVVADTNAPLNGKVGLGYRPINAEYPNPYIVTLAAGGRAGAGTYAFDSREDMINFQNFDAGLQGVYEIDKYYKLDTTLANRIADPISGTLIYSWLGQKLEYDNNVGYLVGKNSTGTITNSFYGTGANTANYIGDDGVRMLGNTEIAADVNPISTNWSSAIWDWTSTNKPILRNAKDEGSEDISEDNLKELEDETKYVFNIHDDFNTTNIWLNTALTSGSYTQVAPSSAPVGTDAAGRPLLASMVLTGITNMYLSDYTVSNNANPSQRFSEGEDFILYTNDNGATWKMDIFSSSMYGKTLKIDYAGASTAAANQSNSGFNVYLGDNKNLNVRDMTLDLAGRLNFNITREDGPFGALDALNDTLTYMKIKQSELKGEIQAATAALSNKTAQTTTMTTAVKNIVSVDEAKAKAELAKKQLLQSKTDTILQKFYDLQSASMQTLLSTSFSNNSNAYSGIYSGMKGVNSLYNKNIVDYNYKTLFDILNADS